MTQAEVRDVQGQEPSGTNRLRSCNRQEMDSSLEPPEGTQACQPILDFRRPKL